MVNVSKADLDAACAAYGRATGDSPRREGIRVALHSYRQMNARDRSLAVAGIERLRSTGFGIYAGVIERLMGLADDKVDGTEDTLEVAMRGRP